MIEHKKVDLNDFMLPIRNAFKSHYGQKAEPDAATWLNGFIKGINELCAKGYRFICILGGQDIDWAYLEKTEKAYQYKIDYGNTLDEAGMGADMVNTVEELENVHASIFLPNINPTPMYMIVRAVDEKDQVLVKKKAKLPGPTPFFRQDEMGTSPEIALKRKAVLGNVNKRIKSIMGKDTKTAELALRYKGETGQQGMVAGKQTKAFKAWIEAQE